MCGEKNESGYSNSTNMVMRCVNHTKAQIRQVIVVVIVIVEAHVYGIDRRVDHRLLVGTDVGAGDQLEAAKVGRRSFRVSVTLAVPVGTLLNAKDVLTAVKVHLGRVLARDYVWDKEKSRRGGKGEEKGEH